MPIPETKERKKMYNLSHEKVMLKKEHANIVKVRGNFWAT